MQTSMCLQASWELALLMAAASSLDPGVEVNLNRFLHNPVNELEQLSQGAVGRLYRHRRPQNCPPHNHP